MISNLGGNLVAGLPAAVWDEQIVVNFYANL